MEPTTMTIAGYAAAVLLMIIAGLYVIAAAPARYNGARSDAPRYRDGWHLPERIVMLALLIVLSAVLIPAKILMEVSHNDK